MTFENTYTCTYIHIYMYIEIVKKNSHKKSIHEIFYTSLFIRGVIKLFNKQLLEVVIVARK